MWEVFSLGDVPYSAGITWSPEFVKYLRSGFRLQVPQYATDEMYEVIHNLKWISVIICSPILIKLWSIGHKFG